MGSSYQTELKIAPAGIRACRCGLKRLRDRALPPARRLPLSGRSNYHLPAVAVVSGRSGANPRRIAVGRTGVMRCGRVRDAEFILVESPPGGFLASSEPDFFRARQCFSSWVQMRQQGQGFESEGTCSVHRVEYWARNLGKW